MSDAFVEARSLSKCFGKKAVLRDVTLNVRPGEVVGVLGKNAAGKTTLLDLILGFTRPTSGNIEVFGSESFSLPGAAKERIGFVPQQDELINQLSGSNHLKVVGSFYPNWDESLIRR